MARRSFWVVVACGAGTLLLHVVLATAGDLTERLPLFLSVSAVLFALYVLTIVVLTRMHEPYRNTVLLIIIVAALARVVHLPSAPVLSTDIYRYLWEGRVIAAGENPFEKAPGDEALVELRDEDYDGVSHKHMVTIYPPLAQGMFWLGASIHPSLTFQKVLFTVCDMAALVVLLLILRARRMNLNLAVVWAWSPLVIIEFSHSGHVDSLGIVGFLLALLLLEKRRTAGAFVALACSFLSKYLAVLLVPFFVMRRAYGKYIALLVVIVAVGYLPFAGAGEMLVASLRAYGRDWHFNSLVFDLLRRIIPNPDLIRLAIAAVLGVVALWQARRQQDVARYAYIMIAAVLLLSPTVYPWYVTWIVPFIALFRSRAWLAFTGLVIASYWVWVPFRAGGEWAPPMWLLLVEYMPFYVLLAGEVLRGRRAEVAA